MKSLYCTAIYTLFFVLLLQTTCAVSAPIKIVDDTGYTLYLKQPAMRVLALYGAFNEYFLALELQDRLVGRTSADASIEALRHLPAVGTHMRPNTERIVALQADVVLQLLGRSEAESFGLELRRLGVPVLFFRLENFADMFRVLQSIGVMTGTEERTQALQVAYAQRLESVKRAFMHKPKVSVFYEVRYPNLLAAGEKSIVNCIIDVAGGYNVVSNAAKVVRLNEEEVLRLNPQAYIIQKGPMNSNPVPVEQRRHYATLTAVRQERVLIVDEFAFARPGPRAIDAVEMLAQWLHGKNIF